MSYRQINSFLIYLILFLLAILFIATADAQEIEEGLIDTTPYLDMIYSNTTPTNAPIITTGTISRDLTPVDSLLRTGRVRLETETTPEGTVTTGEIDGQRVRIESDIPGEGH